MSRHTTNAPGGNRTRGLRLESATSVSRDVRDVAALRAIGLLPMPFAMQFGPVARDLVAANGQAGERARRPTRSPPRGCAVPAVIGWSVGEPTEGPAQPPLARPRPTGNSAALECARPAGQRGSLARTCASRCRSWRTCERLNGQRPWRVRSIRCPWQANSLIPVFVPRLASLLELGPPLTGSTRLRFPSPGSHARPLGTSPGNDV